MNDSHRSELFRYEQMIENAFEHYKRKLQNQTRLEQQNNNNRVVIAQINLILHSLELQKKNILTNLISLFENSDNMKSMVLINICLLRSVLNIYSKDLDRGIVLLENEYEYYLRDHDILKVETELVNKMIELIRIRNKK
ncbi:hypothetical protein [Candidatus Nitrosocosmicus sp. FF01]|uniref:hypothetical protein n=1 Tax=Candidatus Nitrosocosmicus sp. FF01 TaxID=3397670 RepID=UPI0039EC74CD